MDEWKIVWDWVKATWGDNSDYSLEQFFRRMASQQAQAEGWEELGSSDVWHFCFGTVQYLKRDGKTTTREQLERGVRDGMGCY